MKGQITDNAVLVNGRPLRVLHIGNIANNAFNIAKLQRQVGIEADVLCCNYFHVMGAPEWEDAQFEGHIKDHFFPKWHQVNLNGYRRPEWFVQGTTAAAINYLIARNQRKKWLTAYYRLKMSIMARLPAAVLFYDPKTAVHRKIASAVLMPESLANGATESLCTTFNIPEAMTAQIKFGMLSSVMLLTALALVLLVVLLLPVALVAAAALALLLMFRFASQFIIQAPAWSGNLADRGVQFWLFWLHLPKYVINRVQSQLNQLFRTTWFSRYRSQCIVGIAIMPFYAILTFIMGMTVTATLICSAPLMILLLCVRNAVKKAFGERWLQNKRQFTNRMLELIQLWGEIFPNRQPLTKNDFQKYQNVARLYQELLSYYDIVQAYSTDPIIPLLFSKTPYVAYEHGTLREIPFQDDDIGKLTALAYRLSNFTFITNGDCRQCALTLGVPRFNSTLHGIDDSKFRRNHELRSLLCKHYGVTRLYLCPIRHDWSVKGTDQHIRALPKLIERTGKDFKLIMIQWGMMIEDSKALAHSLDVAAQIIWIEPLPKRTLIDWIGAMDCVLDQIMLPHFGATAPEAMGCGVPVISSYDPASTEWIVAEPAPILPAFTPEQIAEQLVRLTNPGFHAMISETSLTWFRKNHSSDRLLRDHLRVYAELLHGKQSSLRPAA